MPKAPSSSPPGSTGPSLRAIWIKRARKGPMDPADSATFVAGEGLRGNANQGGRRQVTVISEEVFEEIRRELPDARPVMRRANLMVRGLDLEDTCHHVLRVGDVRIRIGGETRPCNRMDEQCPGLTDALDPHWRGGVFGVVLEGGQVRVGDPVSIQAPADRQEG